MSFLTLVALAILTSPSSRGVTDYASPVPKASRQLVLVLTENPSVTTGTLHRFTRDSESSSWKRVGEPWPIVVGRTGLASGRGFHRGSLPGLAAKTEGDNKSPAGVFALTQAFGFSEKPKGLAMPYLPVSKDLECVDDSASSRYNQLVARGSVEKADWKSSEKMREIEVYQWGVVVAHNAEPVSTGEGSCIFLHAWSGPKSTTAGCTAMEPPRIEELVRWLRADDSPVLVQLTTSLYRELKSTWRLPAVAP